MKISAKEMRIDILKMGFAAKGIGAHFGGSLSLVEIFSSLYSHANFKSPQDENRDRIILSKGHGAMAQYAALKQLGFYNNEDLATFKATNATLSAHPCMSSEKGIEFSSGSLGQGLSLGVGVALALKKKNLTSKVFVILGDGECNEGQIWEAVACASHYNLNNLITIIDKNNLQNDGTTNEILKMNLKTQFSSFYFDVLECNGHNEKELLEAYNSQKDRPLAIIANTIKGKGVGFMENQVSWHYGVLTKNNYEIAINEVENA